MSTRIRLRRMGSNKRPFYRVVVADQRSPRNGRFIEIIGKYHPLNDPSVIEIDEARALHWLMVGAQPSNQVRNLMSKVGIWDKFVAERPGAAIAPTPKDDRPARAKISKKAQAKAAEAAKAADEPVAERPEPQPEPQPEPEPVADAGAPIDAPAAQEPVAEAEPDAADDDVAVAQEPVAEAEPDAAAADDDVAVAPEPAEEPSEG
jgi:small subunit ribosomal protein S16